MLKKSIVAVCIAALAVIVSPTAASAAPVDPSASCSAPGDTYVNDRLVTSDSYVVEPGGTFSVDWREGFFEPSAPVTVVVTGESSSDATLTTGGVSTIGSSLDTVAGADGSLSVSVKVPATASGTYNVQAMSVSACGGVSVEVTDTDTSGGVLGSGVNADTDNADANDSDSLAFTGGSVPLVLMITAAGVLAFGGIMLLVRSRARRHVQE